MMLNFMVAPDYLPQHFGAWFLLNNYVQQQTGLAIRLHVPNDHDEQQALLPSTPELVYVNPFDASTMMHQYGYRPLAKPAGKFDEMVVACRYDAPYLTLHDVHANCRVAFSDNEDVHLIGMRLLEGFGLGEHNTQAVKESSQAAVLSALYHGRADIGFLLNDVFNHLSSFSHHHFRSLLGSQIHDIYHLLLIHPKAEQHKEALCSCLTEMNQNTAGQEILAELGMPDGFAPVSQEEVEFMIDLMETLKD